MKFVDQAVIRVKSGKGGSGCCSFRREKYEAKGGPNGGDGGRGGDVIFETSTHMSTLLDFQMKREHFAKSGYPGEGSLRKGKRGADIVLKVPVGTMIYDNQTGLLMADMVNVGDVFCAAKGGRGGWGNARFKTSVTRSPRHFDKGLPAQEHELRLELKVLADVGLVGLPNAGKSTLISRFSAARPKVANYPFTTLQPVLGVVDLGYGDSYVMADIPGLIEGAHTGAGYGDDFLRHVERCRLLILIIDVADMSAVPLDSYRILKKEMKAYSPDLVNKKTICVLNKVEVLTDDNLSKLFREEVEEDVFEISAVTGQGLDALKKNIIYHLRGSSNDDL
ncbi:hypothetical protein AB834_06560 [PVC group bacterium (ex Bugula neritina AB1)]|nr:hypothetical protein AB834_06560 [PVC group bacterium (ex Bugula neritina AB1)]